MRLPLFFFGALVLVALASPVPARSGALAPVAASATPEAAPDLPEIGRVRSLTPSCAVLRDLAIPAFGAVLKENQLFNDSAPFYAKWAEAVVDDSTNTAVRDMYLSRMGQNLANMFAETQKIGKALGDPRLQVKGDPFIDLERRQLQQLYDVQASRENVMSEFLIRQNVAIGKTEFADNSAFQGGRGAGQSELTPQATPTPFEVDRRKYGQPVLSGKNGFADKHVMSDWTANLGAEAKISTEAAARAFYPIGKTCASAQ